MRTGYAHRVTGYARLHCTRVPGSYCFILNHSILVVVLQVCMLYSYSESLHPRGGWCRKVGLAKRRKAESLHVPIVSEDFVLARVTAAAEAAAAAASAKEKEGPSR